MSSRNSLASSIAPFRRNASTSQSLQDRPIAKTRGAEIALTSWQFMFAEIVTYTQKRVAGITDFEKKCVMPFSSASCAVPLPRDWCITD